MIYSVNCNSLQLNLNILIISGGAYNFFYNKIIRVGEKWIFINARVPLKDDFTRRESRFKNGKVSHICAKNRLLLLNWMEMVFFLWAGIIMKLVTYPFTSFFWFSPQHTHTHSKFSKLHLYGTTENKELILTVRMMFCNVDHQTIFQNTTYTKLFKHETVKKGRKKFMRLPSIKMFLEYTLKCTTHF